MDLRLLPLRRVFFVVAIAKAAIAGASIGIAAMGLTDLAFMVTAASWWAEFRADHLLNEFALAGSVIGVAAKLAGAFRA